MKNDLMYVISLKVEDLVSELARRNSVPGTLVDVRLDRYVLSICLNPLDRGLSDNASDDIESSVSQTTATTVISKPATRIRRPRAGRLRNRMMTRGWDVVGQVVNKYGQKSNVYRPFVEALNDTTLSMTDQRAAVSKILRANGTSPSPDSIDYFLEKTLQYLAEKGGQHA